MNKGILSVFRICLLSLAVLTCVFNSNAQEIVSDTTKFLQVVRLNISANNLAIKPNVPSFNKFQDDFRFGNKFLTSTLSEFSEDEFIASSFYAGFMVNFIFQTNAFAKDRNHNRNYFSIAFESGHTDNELYRLVSSDTSRLTYTFSSDIFRITMGYRRVLTKKEKRLKFYAGLELINEFNISGAIFEKQFDTDYDNMESERKLFTKKGYNLYLNIPLGLDYRLFKRATLFFHMNTALGSQNSDPLRLNGIFTGTRFGISLKI